MNLTNLSRHFPDARFNEYRISGSSRIISVPNRTMRRIHRRLIAYLRSRELTHPASRGGQPSGSTIKAILPHQNNRFFYHLDLSSAYNQIDLRILASKLANADPNLGSEEGVRDFLVRFCSNSSGKLATGSPSSVDLFNIYLALLDGMLADLCEKEGISYSRYLDDMIFSSNIFPLGQRMRRNIRRIIEGYGLTINHSNSHFYDLFKGPVFILGIGISCNGRLFVPRLYFRAVRGLVHLSISHQSPLELDHIIAGKMSPIIAMASVVQPNKTEQVVIEQYQEYKLRLKNFRPKRTKKRAKH